MKETILDFYRTNGVKVIESDESEFCAIYRKSTKDGHWFAKLLTDEMDTEIRAKTKKEALILYMESGLADTSKVEKHFEAYYKARKKRDKYNQMKSFETICNEPKTYQKCFGNFISKVVEADTLEYWLCDDVTMCIDWKEVNSVENGMGETL